ncbi:AAA family ATPase [Micromonospora sp. WMMD1128]|uniref:ATP-binding protein n=1 Tax=Micromonospora sp. WMMD1128 TaxID=3015150 RepID=UPI00248C4B1E|nr:LuxR family transcriptional regulator [Micromonospora sp. WMMD1128]WBB71283.1 AAA family ATPase [Micromonospora sp. WMMD1128]
MNQSTGELIERDEHLQILQDLLSAALEGRGQAIVLSGASGSGKTVLLNRLAHLAAEAGAEVVAAVASRTEQSLPLGVIGQLAHGAGLVTGHDSPIAGLLDEAMSGRWDSSSTEQIHVQPSARILHSLCMALLRRAADQPLVVYVDDVHHADPSSLECLSYLMRRVRNARMLVVLAVIPQLAPAHPMQYAELLHSSAPVSLSLRPLSRQGIGQVLDRLPQPADRGLTAQYHAITGGNPRLATALVGDSLRRIDHGADGTRTVVGETFLEAVRTCLYRSEPPALPVARALAVAGVPTEPAVLARLLSINEEMVRCALLTLRRVGLLSDGTFRDPRIRTAVLAGMLPDERTDLHRRLASVSHAAGEPATVVARHLVDADRVDGAWVAPTLHEAADQALADGRVEDAISFLDSACTAGVDERQRAEATSALTRIEWQTNPADAARRLPELVAAVRAGVLVRRHAVALVAYLLWHAHIDDAVEVITLLTANDPMEPEFAASLSVPLLLLAYLFPDHLDRVRGPWDNLAARGLVPPPCRPLQAAAELTALAARSPHGDAVAAAEQVVHNTRVDHEALGPISIALLATIFTDRIGATGSSHYPVLHRAADRRTPTTQALVSAILAEGTLGRGDLAATEEHARRGLDLIPAKGWGVAVGALLSNMVLATTISGAYDAAEEWLSIPVPAAMFDTPFGLKYLHARGTYYLRTNCVRAALIDFQACGRMMIAWELDLPELVPWRTELARAHLALGRTQQARELARDQLSRLPQHNDRERGSALWVLALASDPAERLALLQEAVSLLRASDDELSTACATADLGDALHRAGDADAARAAWQTARRLARRSGAEPLLDRLRGVLGPDDPDEPAEPGALGGSCPHLAAAIAVDGLTDAERRVAALAAVGHTNRAIATKLYVTVSTVEQHLTRVYRKLQVSRRTDLPTGLIDDPAGDGTRSPDGSQVSVA